MDKARQLARSCAEILSECELQTALRRMEHRIAQALLEASSRRVPVDLDTQAILWNPENEKRFKFPLRFKDGLPVQCPYCGAPIVCPHCGMGLGEIKTSYPPLCGSCNGQLPNPPKSG